MKTKIMKLLVTALATTYLLSSMALANGEREGHGGGLIYLNGIPQIADPFVKSPYDEGSMTLSTEMRTLMDSIKELLVLRGIDVRNFFNATVLGRSAEYIYTTKLPCDDTKDLVTVNGAPLIEYGCTLDGSTYILKSEFEKLSFQDQALALIHERLHALNPKAAHHHITGFIKIVRRMLELIDAQAKGNREKLSETDMTTLYGLYPVSERLGFRVEAAQDARNLKIEIASNGGGILRESTLTGNTWVGITSCVVQSSLENSTIQNTIVHNAQMNEVTANDSDFWFTKISKSAIDDSKLENAIVTDSKVGSCKLFRARMNGSECKNSALTGFAFYGFNHSADNSDRMILNQARLIDSTIVNNGLGSFTVNPKVTMKSAHIEVSGYVSDVTVEPKSGRFELDGKKHVFTHDGKNWFGMEVGGRDFTLDDAQEFMRKYPAVNE